MLQQQQQQYHFLLSRGCLERQLSVEKEDPVAHFYFFSCGDFRLARRVSACFVNRVLTVMSPHEKLVMSSSVRVAPTVDISNRPLQVYTLD